MKTNASAPRFPNTILSQNKHLWSAALNMARHNVYVIFQEISAYLNRDKGEIEDDSKLFEAWILRVLSPSKNDKKKGIKATPEQLKDIIYLLRRHFPFIAETDTPKVIKNRLKDFLVRLNQKRNAFTHVPYFKDKKQGIDLWPIVEAARNKLSHNIQTGLKDTHRPYRGLEKEALDRLDALSKELGRFAWEASVPLGSLFFVSLFLEKKYASQLMSQLKLTLGSEGVDARLIEEWCWQYCCKLPRPKLESSDVMMDMLNELGRCPEALYYHLSKEDKEKFLMNEYLALEEDKGLGADQLRWLNTIMKRHDNRFPYFALRYFDENPLGELRFQVHLGKQLQRVYDKQHFGQRKIYQELNTFGRLSYYTETNTPEDWKKGQEVFKKPEEEDAILAERSTAPEWMNQKIKQFAPRYQITGNRIGLKFTGEDYWYPLKEYDGERQNRKEKLQPDAILSTYELPNLFFFQYLHEQGLIERDAAQFIKGYKDRFLKFYKDVKDEKIQPVSSDKFMKKSKFPYQRKGGYDEGQKKDLEKRTAKLQEKLEEYGLKTKDLPDRLREYLLGYAKDNKRYLAKRKVRTKIDEVERLERQLNKEKERIKDLPYGSPSRLKNGALATWLARDIIFFQKVDKAAELLEHKGKSNNEQYNRLQSYLAYFSRDKLGLETFLERLDILAEKKEDDKHPFLRKVGLMQKGIKHFYEDYLSAKKKWLHQLFKEDKDGGWQYFEPDAKPSIKNYRSTPILLPRNLFNEAILKALQDKGYEVAPKAPWNTVNLMTCIEAYCGKDEQPFYQLYRHYAQSFHYLSEKSGKEENEEKATSFSNAAEWEKIKKEFKAEITELEAKLPKLDNKPSNEEKGQEIKVEKKALSTAEAKQIVTKKLLCKIMHNEQQIRYAKLTDRILMLMIRQLIQKKEAFDHRFAENSTDVEQNQERKLSLKNIGYPAAGEDKNNLLNEAMDLSVNVGQHTINDQLPIRRYGDFRRFLKDKRLENLLKYYQGKKQIKRLLLQEELAYYDLHRADLMDKILEFETAFYARHQAVLDEVRGNDSHINHTVQLVEFAKIYKGCLDDATIEKMRILRNKFAHNEIPILDDLLTNTKAPTDIEIKEWQEKGEDKFGNPIEKTFTKLDVNGTLVTEQLSQKAISYYQELIDHLESN